MHAAFKKKVIALAKEKDCELVGEWKKSMLNHLYWSAVSTPNGNGDIIKAKWMSLDNHIHNRHKGHGKHFPKCTHKRPRGKRKKWFKPRKHFVSSKLVKNFKLKYVDTKASEKISALICKTQFCNDVMKLSPKYQTSKREAFHSLINNFAPKSVAFTYHGMLSRSGNNKCIH